MYPFGEMADLNRIHSGKDWPASHQDNHKLVVCHYFFPVKIFVIARKVRWNTATTFIHDMVAS